MKVEEDAPAADSATVARASASQSNHVAGHRVDRHLIESDAKTLSVGSWGARECLGCAP